MNLQVTKDLQILLHRKYYLAVITFTITLISALFLLSYIHQTNALVLNNVENLGIGYTLNSRSMYSNSIEDSVPLSEREGMISPNGQLFAYKLPENTESESHEHSVFIQDFQSKEVIGQISLPASLDYKFISWSPDSSKLIIMEYAHYVGGLQFHIIDIGSMRIEITTAILNELVYWASNDQFLYFSPSNECELGSDNCHTLSPALNKYSIVLQSETELTRLTLEDTFITVDYIEMDHLGLTLLVKEFLKEGGVIDFENFQEKYLRFDLQSNKVSNISASQLETVQKALPDDISDLSIVSLVENPAHPGLYLLALSSLFDDDRHYFGEYDSSNQSVTIRGAGYNPYWGIL